jgi:hypothetical protein
LKLDIFSQIIFTLCCAVAATVVAVHDRLSGHFQVWLGVPMVSWFILAALIFPIIFVATFGMSMLVKLLEAIVAKLELHDVHYVLMGLNSALRYDCSP